LFSGCRLGPRYQPPDLEDVPDHWKAATANGEAICSPSLEDWWEIFDDETLNQLEREALLYNPNLYVALERVIQARANSGVHYADLFPQVTLDPNLTYSENYVHLHLPGKLIRTLPPGLPISSRFRLSEIKGSVPFDLSYQVDLWGKYRGQFESALLSAEAQQEAYYGAILTLTSDLASAYFQLRTLDAQIEVYRKTLEERRKSYQLNESRYIKGIGNLIDASNAALQLTNVEASYYDAIRQRALQEDAIAILIGRPPSDLTLEPRPLETPPPLIPPGIPSEVLLRRPDIAQAERTIASQHALIGVAYASFFPSLALTGSVGADAAQLAFSGSRFHGIIDWSNFFWQTAANISQSIFDAGRNCANLAGTKSAYREAVDNYRQQVLIAFREVEDALNDLEWEEKQGRSLEESVKAAKLTASLSLKRYRNGLVTYLEVVDSESAALAAEQNWITVLGSRYIATVQLIKAIGGGWNADSKLNGFNLDEDICFSPCKLSGETLHNFK